MKKSLCAVVLLACFVTVVMAADHRQPASVGEYSGLSQVRTGSAQSPAAPVRCAGVAAYYYYAGSFDSTASSANGLANEADTIVSTGSQIYQPFSVKIVAANKHLSVTGLCINSLDTGGAGIDNPTPYEVRSGAVVGSGGKLVCHGTATSSQVATGRIGFGITEYTHAVKTRKCTLAAGAGKGRQYHQNVEPQCFKNSVCGGARFFESTDDSNISHVGRPTNRGAALWNSAFFSETWVNPNTIFGGTAMTSFSAGVSGKLVP